MKINKKVLIPIFATAMGLSVVGGVSGAVAWYQYNTKVQASWMGVTMADGGVLQIRDKSGATPGDWGRFARFGSDSTKLHPVTFGEMTATSALPEHAYKHPHAGITDTTNKTNLSSSWDTAVLGTDYYQFKFELQALKLDEATTTNQGYKNIPADVYLDELILESATENKTLVGEAVRVHISAGTANNLYAKTAGSTDVFGELDLDRDNKPDEIGGYAWEYDTTHIIYGEKDKVQVASALAPSSSTKLFEVPAEGLEVTVTIWLEGWQKINNSAIWDATRDAGASIHFGMKLSTPKTTFLAD